MAEMLKEISANLLQMREVELRSKIVSSRFLLSTKEAAELLGNIDVRKVINMYKDGVISGIEDGKQIKIYRESLERYIEKTKSMTQDAYFTNVQNIMKKAKVTRSEYEKMTEKKKNAKEKLKKTVQKY
ncbi:MAG: helix-turn-helix domain-containing protein [Bacteroidetes bacterium]|nr:helix-turn-helix domain-containing protein [Bacteroidota bacterium]